MQSFFCILKFSFICFPVSNFCCFYFVLFCSLLIFGLILFHACVFFLYIDKKSNSSYSHNLYRLNILLHMHVILNIDSQNKQKTASFFVKFIRIRWKLNRAHTRTHFKNKRTQLILQNRISVIAFSISNLLLYGWVPCILLYSRASQIILRNIQLILVLCANHNNGETELKYGPRNL